MSLDFALTQFYRLAVDDLIIIYDSYRFYAKLKPAGKSVHEFVEILQNVVEVEQQNFEDIDESKLSHGGESSLSLIAWDYFANVILKYLLDDLSQFPFWKAKIAIATTNEPLGKGVVSLFLHELHHMFTSGHHEDLLTGCSPYLIASFIGNFPYLVKNTHNFLLTVWSKIPRPPSVPKEMGRPDLQDLSTLASSHNLGKVSLSSLSPQKKKKSGKAKEHGSFWEQAASNLAVTVLSHPFLVISVNMIANSIYSGRTWVYAYFRIFKDQGLRALYTGMRSRALFAVLPISPFVLWGVADSIVYRRILGQGSFDSTGGVLSIAREIANQEQGSALTLFNYGVLTAVHAVPGFLSFLGVRCLSSFVFGSSAHRKDQMARRKEIVEAHLNKLKKKSSSAKLNFSV